MGIAAGVRSKILLMFSVSRAERTQSMRLTKRASDSGSRVTRSKTKTCQGSVGVRRSVLAYATSSKCTSISSDAISAGEKREQEHQALWFPGRAAKL